MRGTAASRAALLRRRSRMQGWPATRALARRQHRAGAEHERMSGLLPPEPPPACGCLADASRLVRRRGLGAGGCDAAAAAASVCLQLSRWLEQDADESPQPQPQHAATACTPAASWSLPRRLSPSRLFGCQMLRLRAACCTPPGGPIGPPLRGCSTRHAGGCLALQRTICGRALSDRRARKDVREGSV